MNARKATPRISLDEREELYRLRSQSHRFAMAFYSVEEGAPDEGNLVLVRLRDSTFRFGMVLKGQFATYAYHSGEFVTMPHPERITHWMRIIPPASPPVETEAPAEEFIAAPIGDDPPPDPNGPDTVYS